MSRIVVGVPGPWPDHTALVRAIVSTGPKPRFVAAGNIILDTESGAGMVFELQPHNSQMERAFAIASGGRMSEAELSSIGRHSTTAYLIGQDCSVKGARQVMAAALHLLRAGGFGVKVDSAGLAHAAARWRYLTESPSTLSVYEAFVTLVGGAAGEVHYSCGMHNFGIPDSSVAGSVPARDAAGILTAFNHWALLERPDLRDGSWFSCAVNEPTFLLSRRDYGYDDDDPLNNPFGRWHLDPSDGPPPEGWPTQASTEPLFMAIPQNDPDALTGVERARATTGYFLSHFLSTQEYGHHLMKVELRDGQQSAFFWARLEKAEGRTLTVRLFEMPPQFTSYRAGQLITIDVAEVFDWSIIKSGTLIGGFSMRLQRSKLPAEKRRWFDLYTGTLSYAPLEEIPGS